MDYEDVLDHMGKTPREFGALHVHLESVCRTAGATEAVATLLFQAAFDPADDGARIRFFTASSADRTTQVAELKTPKLEGGAVVRARDPLHFEASAVELFLHVESTIPGKAQRVRPAWKLHDTIEIPKLSEMSPGPIASPGVNVGRSLLASALTGSLVLSINIGRAVDGDAKTVVHKAQALPRGLKVAVEERETQVPVAPEIELIWKPGMPLPPAASAPSWTVAEPIPAATAGLRARTCFRCGFEGDGATYERTRFCPNCDAIWV